MTVTPIRARRAPVATVQGTLALDLRQPWEPPLPDHLEVVPPEVVVVAPRGRAADLDDVAQGFARALVEVLGGERGAGQLLPWSTPEVQELLRQRTALLTRTVPADRRVRRLRSRLLGVRTTCPAAGVAEISIHLRRGERSHAVAARLEHRVQRRRGRVGAAWVCTALEIG